MFFVRYVFGVMFLGCLFFQLSEYQKVGAEALSIEPARVSLELVEPSASSIVVISNQHDYEVSLTAEFKSIDEIGGRIIPSGDLSQELATALKLSETKFSIPPNTKYYLTITAADSESLSSGGHYASLVLTDASSSQAPQTVRSQVSVGVFVVKPLGEVTRIDMTKKEFIRQRFGFPTSASLEFYNDGNVHVVPRGYVRIYDSEHVYYETILNNASTTVLPMRRYAEQMAIAAQTQGFMPRKITAEIGYRADGIDALQIHTEEFWYVPTYSLPIPIVLTLILAGFMVRRIKKAYSSK